MKNDIVTVIEITGFLNFKKELISRLNFSEEKAQRVAELNFDRWFENNKEKEKYFNEFDSMFVRVEDIGNYLIFIAVW